ncbi:DUF1014 domain containing protein [Asbolus verrucosus]|uniref:DUF1014 domain containing protein n=1 Tax=Asbolus verrucosus TaxID=1661398 RepID=A0A482VM43_ASBVE|nr:DUF1014 domain containing protein [Asbolus verrucosus]
MPKKFSTEHPRITALRERKKSAKGAEASNKQQKESDAYWQDDDKLIKKKQQRKEEQEKKREQQLAKKAENKLLLEKEMSGIKSGKVPPPKLTRAQINSTVNVPKMDYKTKNSGESLSRNMNRIPFEGEEARSVNEAISLLGGKSAQVDKHPEKRQKAAYSAYENRRLNELKTENPSLRLSQVKQMLFKEWQKAAENPMNMQ